VELRLDEPRRRLRDITPTGGFRIVRLIAFGIATACAVVVVVTLPFATHQVRHFKSDTFEPRVHELLSETLFIPMIVALGLLLALVWTARGRLLRTVLMAPVISAVSLCTFVGVAIQHLFSYARGNLAENATYLGLLGVFFGGGVIFVLEWIVVIGERRKLETTVDPVFPSARVVR
jgi:hypothetical protein